MSKKTSSRHEASKAGAVLADQSASNRERKLAASVLSQARTGAETSPQMANFAARVLSNPNASETSHSLAGSVLSQTEKTNK